MRKTAVMLSVLLVSCVLPACGNEAAVPETPPAGIEDTAGNLSGMETQTIGNDELGYVTLPGDWLEFRDLNGAADLQYSNPAGTSIVSLNIFDLSSLTEEQRAEFTAQDAADNVWYNLEQSEVEDINGATVTLGGYQAFEIYGQFLSEDHDLPSAIVCWIFEDGAGVFHYVSAEGAIEDFADVFSYVEESYTLSPGVS